MSVIANVKQGRSVSAGFVAILVIGIILSSGSVSAQFSSSEEVNESCGSGGAFATQVEEIPANSTLYARANVAGASYKAAIYLQALSGDCTKLGAATIKSNRWTKIGRIPRGQTAGGLLISGKNIVGDPFSTIATALIIPGSLCKPTTDCVVRYQAQKGVLEPKTVSSKSDILAAKVAKPVKGVDYTKVDYYANDQFLYTNTQLADVNRNYLGGGKQRVERRIYLSDGQKVTLRETVDMGSDPGGTLLVRSWFYRQSGGVKLLSGVFGFVLVVVLGIGIVRFIRRRRLRAAQRGLQNYR